MPYKGVVPECYLQNEKVRHIARQQVEYISPNIVLCANQIVDKHIPYSGYMGSGRYVPNPTAKAHFSVILLA